MKAAWAMVPRRVMPRGIFPSCGFSRSSSRGTAWPAALRALSYVYPRGCGEVKRPARGMQQHKDSSLG